MLKKIFNYDKVKLIILFLIAFCFFFSSLNSLDSSVISLQTIKASFVKEITIMEQKPHYRNWEKVNLMKKSVISDSKKFPLLNLNGVKIDSKNNIFVSDWGDLSIKQISADGKYIKKYGAGKGEGPGEFLNPTDFALSNDKVLVCDGLQNSVTFFDINSGTANNYLKPYNSAFRIAAIGSNKFISMNMHDITNLFTIYDYKAKQLNSFGKILNDQNNYSMALDGYITSDEFNNSYYVIIKSGYFLSYDENGLLRYASETIDKTELPQIKKMNVKGTTVTKFNDSTPFSNESINYDNGFVFILANTNISNNYEPVIDKYDSKNGKYISSIRLPERVKSVFVKNNTIYAINSSSIIIWNLKY